MEPEGEVGVESESTTSGGRVFTSLVFIVVAGLLYGSQEDAGAAEQERQPTQIQTQIQSQIQTQSQTTPAVPESPLPKHQEGAVAPLHPLLSRPTLFESDLLRYRSYFQYGGFEPDLAALLPQGYVSQWHFGAGLQGEYSDNVDQEADRRTAFSSSGTLGLDWLRVSPRLKASADYRFATPLYQSESISGRNTTSHALGGVANWQASQYLSIDLGGHVTQNLEGGLDTPLAGVRSSFNNRSDEYSARTGYSWRLSRALTNSSDYQFRYRNFVSDTTEGEDTRSHRAGTSLGWQVSARDMTTVGYRYSVEDDLSAPAQRRNHIGSVRWGHTFLTFPGNRRSELGFSYSADRGLGSEGLSYWNHSGAVSYSWAMSPRTAAGLSLGYQWIEPERGTVEQGVTYSGNLAHQFTEYTTGVLAFGESWDYEPASTRSDFTSLTRTRRVTGSLRSRLSRDLNGRVGAGYVEGDPKLEFGPIRTDEYWEVNGAAGVSGPVGNRGFWGLGYSLFRRQTDENSDDYLLQSGNLYYRHAVWEWMSATVSYLHERRDYDSESFLADYHENRISCGVTASW